MEIMLEIVNIALIVLFFGLFIRSETVEFKEDYTITYSLDTPVTQDNQKKDEKPYFGFPLYKNLPICNVYTDEGRDRWTSQSEGIVMCKSLGFTDTISAEIVESIRTDNKYKSFVKSIRCTGNEDHINNCRKQYQKKPFVCNHLVFIICKDLSTLKFENNGNEQPQLMNTKLGVYATDKNLKNTARLVCNRFHKTVSEESTATFYKYVEEPRYQPNNGLCLISECDDSHFDLKECVTYKYKCENLILLSSLKFISVKCEKCSFQKLITILKPISEENFNSETSIVTVEKVLNKFKEECDYRKTLSSNFLEKIYSFLEDVLIQLKTESNKKILISSEIDVFQLLKDVGIQNQFRELKKENELMNNELSHKLGNYFGELADYDNKIAFADIGYSYQVWISAKNELEPIQKSLKHDLESIKNAVKLSSILDTVSNSFQLIVSFLSIIDPSANPADSLNGVMDRLNTLYASIRNIQVSNQLEDTRTNIEKKINSLNEKKIKNRNAFAKLLVLIEKARTDANSIFTYADAKDFLSQYNDFTPAITNSDVEEFNEYISQILEWSCNYIENPSTSFGMAGTNDVTVKGLCPKAKVNFATAKALYLDMATHQFELMSSFSRAARSKIAEQNAQSLKTAFNKKKKYYEEIDIIKASFFYRIHKIRLINEACNYLTYMYYGEEPDICKTLRNNPDEDGTILTNYKIKSMCNNDVSDSISRIVRIPVNTTSLTNDMIDLNSLFNVGLNKKIGVAYFRIPNKDWLIQNNWIEQHEAEEGPFFIQNFNIYIPTFFSNDNKKRVRIQIKIKALEIKLNSKEYILGRNGMEFVNRYSYNDDCNEILIDDPYKKACSPKPEKLCVETSGNKKNQFNDHENLFPKLEDTVWKLTLESNTPLSSLFPAATTYFYGSVKLCFKKSRRHIEKRSIILKERTCCEKPNVYNPRTDSCESCPSNSEVRLFDFYCETCPAGYEQSSGIFGCEPCTIDHMKASDGPGFCIPCPSGKFAPRKGSTACQPNVEKKSKKFKQKKNRQKKTKEKKADNRLN